MAVDAKKQKRIICPITFVKNDLCLNEDLNTMFLTPYDTKKIQQDFANGTLEVSVRQPMFAKYGSVKDENPYSKYPYEFMEYANEFTFQDKASSSVVISDYIKMNAFDLINNTLLMFFDSLFDIEITSNYLSMDENNITRSTSKDQSFRSEIMNEIINYTNYNENFIKEINSALEKSREVYHILTSSMVFEVNNNETCIEDKVSILIDSLMQSIFSSTIVAYNNLITEFVVSKIASTPFRYNYPYKKIDHLLYNYFMLKAYGEEFMVSREKYNTIDNSQKYTVITSMMREGLDNCLFILREGFMQIAHTAGMMATNLATFNQKDILDKNFKIVDKFSLEDNL